ncbi:MAG TPA: TadE family protein [Acidisphaera sp.]|nr:TadE family protein [Acidisphaera sp.]
MTADARLMRAVRSWRRCWATVRDARRGNVLVELAVVGSFLCTLVIGLCDFGLALWKQAEVASAARAGVGYIAINGWNQSAAQTAATSATSLAVTASATTYCGCPTGTGVTVQTCGTTCAAYGGSNAATYASVTTQATYTPILTSLWGGRSSVTLTATSVIRY